MQYSVMLYFDDKTNKRINGYIKKLVEYSKNYDVMINRSMPPHITIAMWNGEYNNLDEIQNFAANSTCFDIKFSSIGLFRGEFHYMFLAPVKSNALCDIHTDIYNYISLKEEDEIDNVYKDNDIWVPHTTIGYQVEPSRMGDAVNICSDIILPQTARVIKIGVAICCPFTEIAVFHLKC